MIANLTLQTYGADAAEQLTDALVRIYLLVRPDNAIARGAYDSWGWAQETRLRSGWESVPDCIVHRGSPSIVVEASLAA
ncbi:hypothetical protein [Micromonospora craniellae]|uniref:GNAT family N-acetyltransferase n=1 Tax=Micromonospora craniellae TaxID=2294034 RepID=A0A372FXK6_9ACTN|nr:hypothetical protein [Micromonospora craniellae]QOC93309.1 hypothetical protein ID554_06400 [Micromonospora craniellae]RFS45354.1 hypothetical protein D0Q02_16970 [Micromonospora craniellae]